MGLLNKLRVIFNNKKNIKQANTKDTIIVPYDTSLVILPKYKELSDEDQEEVNKYKEEIKSGDISSLILYAGQMSEYANLNVTLLTQIYFKLTNPPADWELEKLTLEEIMRMRLEAKVNIEELQIYLAGLKNLKQESILRAVAAEEVRKQENKRRFEFLGLFSQAERIHRKNQLEQISSAKERLLITVKTMEQLMQAVDNTIGNEEKIERATDVYNVVLRNKLSNELAEHHIEATRKNVLIQKLDEILELTELIFEEKEERLNVQEIREHLDIEEIESRIIKEIAKMQRKITVYAHTHKQDVEKLREQLDNIIKIHVTSENKEILLKKISNIQKLYQVFQKTIKEEDLEKLYKTKFAILVGDINRRKRRSNPLEEVKDKQELEYYAKIIESKIENILLLRNPEFNELCDIHSPLEGYNNKDVEKMLEAFKRIVKSKSGDISGDKILQDKRILGLIVAFDIINGIKEFGEATYFKRTDTKYVLIDGSFKWEESLPLRTIFYLDENAKRRMPDENSYRKETYLTFDMVKWNLNIASQKDPLIEDFKLLYAGYFREIEDDVLRLPEGIRGIAKSTPNKEEMGTRINIYELFLLGAINQKNIINFPRSLKYIGEYAFMSCTNIEELVLNEGLESIGESAFFGCSKLKEIILPKSMKRLYSGCFASCTSLERIFINEGIEIIGEGAFYNTWNMNFFSIPQHDFYCEGMFDKSPIIREYERDYRMVLQVRGTKLPRKILKEFEINEYETAYHKFLVGRDKRHIEGKRYAQIKMIEYAPYNQRHKKYWIKDDNTAVALKKLKKIEEEYDEEIFKW